MEQPGVEAGNGQSSSQLVTAGRGVNGLRRINKFHQTVLLFIYNTVFKMSEGSRVKNITTSATWPANK